MTATTHDVAVLDPMLPRPFRLAAKSAETADTWTLQFEDLSGGEVAYDPGQFMMIYVFGVGEVPISIAGGAVGGASLEHTVRSVGAVTEAICSLEPGDVVGMRGPFGTSWPLPEAHDGDLLIVAGGIGLAPLRPAVTDALAQADRFRSLSLVYGARTPADLLYKRDLLGWESSQTIEVEVSVDMASGDWWGDVGLVTALIPRIQFDPESTTVFVCGPEVMMRAVARELRGSGVPDGHIWLSMERNMKCAVGFCGHCQYGSSFLCRDGPVGRYSDYVDRLTVDEL